MQRKTVGGTITPGPIHGATLLRLLGLWLCLVVVVGVAFAVRTREAGVFLFAAIWAIAGLILGIRMVRVAVLCDHDLTVRNMFRSYRVPWQNVSDITYGYEARGFGIFPLRRWMSIVYTFDGGSVTVEATEAGVYQSERSARQKSDALQAHWQHALKRGEG